MCLKVLGGSLRLYTGSMVCMRRQEPRASDIQDVWYAGVEQERLLTRSHVCMRRQEPSAATGELKRYPS
jgi:hypothetical protein